MATYTRKDRIVKGLRCCLRHDGKDNDEDCQDCPYYNHEYYCKGELFRKAIGYLNEAGEAYQPEIGYDYNYAEDIYYCGNCGRRVFQNYKHCPKCGEAIDWDDLDPNFEARKTNGDDIVDDDFFEDDE